ncbi:hypothetical protein [Undibacterium sp. Tian12W]|uniref:hypothetical protein n=1 Tax=Undibacterium sp. Tian12W TaxID=3413054 RepID=UPI003BF2B13C
MNHIYYPCWYRLAGKDAYLLWYDSPKNHVVTSAFKKALRFKTIAEIESYTHQHELSLQVNEPLLFDLDAMTAELTGAITTPTACQDMLNAWNLFDDVARSCNQRFDRNQRLSNRIYLKLVWGSNLSALTPPNKEYLPFWTKGQLKIIRKTLRKGLRLFKESVLA